MVWYESGIIMVWFGMIVWYCRMIIKLHKFKSPYNLIHDIFPACNKLKRNSAASKNYRTSPRLGRCMLCTPRWLLHGHHIRTRWHSDRFPLLSLVLLTATVLDCFLRPFPEQKWKKWRHLMTAKVVRDSPLVSYEGSLCMKSIETP
jgi:hypothetical protein